MGQNRPKVLLLGNGINRAFGSDSWSDLLANICDDEVLKTDLIDKREFCDKCHSRLDSFANCPEPFKAILVTNDNIDIKLKSHAKKIVRGNFR